MINLAIDRFPVDSIRRVLDAPIEQWSSGVPCRFRMTSCVFGHGSYDPFDVLAWAYFAQSLMCSGQYDRFDKLCRRFGTPRTVRACKIRALKALERHVLESAVPQLQETT